MPVPVPLDDRTPMPTTIVPRSRVLVVDDEPSIRTVARLMLERAGYAVVEAANAAEAVSQATLAERPFTVVVLDFTLPDRSGTDLLPELRRLVSRARIVLTSGRPEDDFPNHGADGYLAKPFSRDHLVAAVRAVTALTPW